MILISRQYTEATQEISVQEEQDAVLLTHQMSGRWNKVQRISLTRVHIQAIRQSWSSILEQQKTVILEDSLDQGSLKWEIVHITHLEGHIHLYHATTNNAEECVMRIADFETVLQRYEKQP